MSQETQNGAIAALNFFKSKYALDENIISELLEAALSRGGDFAELYFEHRQSTTMLYEDQSVRETGSGVTQGVGIRVVIGDSVGYTYSESFSRESMHQAALVAVQIAKDSARQANPLNATIEGLSDLYPIEKPSVDVRALEKLELIKRADRAARAYHPAITKVSISFADELKRVMIAASDGRLVADTQPLFTFRLSALAEQDGKRERGVGVASGRYGLEFFSVVRTPEEIAEQGAKQAITMLSAQEAPAGSFPIVLAAGESAVLLHEAVGHGLEADFNFKKLSNFTDRIGQKVAGELCTIIDDGTIANSRGSLNIDDEGTPTKKNVLIEDGVLRGYMQDRISSAHFGGETTGNGRRMSFRNFPMPRMTNTYMLAGESTLDEMIGSVSKGLYCVGFGGGQVNINNGDFVFAIPEAYMIEDGKITYPVKGVNLIGNGPDVLSKVTMVGHDFMLAYNGGTCGKNGQGVPVSLGMPSTLVSSITVGGTAKLEGGSSSFAR
jgi:TldD protein